VAPGIEQHSTGLLEWLYARSEDQGPDSPGDIGPYLNEHGLDLHFGHMLVQYLAERGLVQNVSTLGAPDAMINANGIEAVQRLQARRSNPAERAATLRKWMLLWLDQHEENDENVLDWESFLTSDSINYHDKPFSRRDVTLAAEYLHHHHLITAISVAEASDGMIHPQLTIEGHSCITDYGGNVSEYINRGQRGGNITTNNIHMSDSTGNIVVASDNVTQNVNAGLDMTKVLDFAGFVRQTLPVLNLPDDDQQALGEQAEELHSESTASAPDRGRIRRMIDALMQGLQAAAPTVAKTMAIDLGAEAIKSITGG
jgi:hypothetical protein